MTPDATTASNRNQGDRTMTTKEQNGDAMSIIEAAKKHSVIARAAARVHVRTPDELVDDYQQVDDAAEQAFLNLYDEIYEATWRVVFAVAVKEMVVSEFRSDVARRVAERIAEGVAAELADEAVISAAAVDGDEAVAEGATA